MMTMIQTEDTPTEIYSNKSAPQVIHSENSDTGGSCTSHNSQKSKRMDGEEGLEPQLTPQQSSGWELIRQMDDLETWAERNRVISKQDHILYTECAKDFVEEIIDSIPVNTNERSDIPDYGILGSDIGSQQNVESPQNNATRVVGTIESDKHYPNREMNAGQDDYMYMNEFGDDEFQNSVAQFDVDFLERMSSKNNAVPVSSLARESLYVRFDPLVGGRHSPKQGIVPTPPLSSHRHSGRNLLMLDTPPKINQTVITTTSSHTPSSKNLLNFNDSPDLAPSKHYTPKIRTSSPSNRTLLDSSPPLPQLSVIKTSPEPTIVGDELVKVLKYSEADVQAIIQKMKEENEEKIEEFLSAIREENSYEISKMQKQIDHLVKTVQNLRAPNTIQAAGHNYAEEKIEEFRVSCSEYEEANLHIKDQYEKLKNETKAVEKQRDQALSDLTSLENSFTDFHQRYTKTKETVATYKQNELELQETITNLQEHIKQAEEMNNELQQQLVIKLQEANTTFEQMKKENMSDVAVMKATLKKMNIQNASLETHIASLEKQLQQKEQEKTELTQICEDLMKELGNKL